ncbi:hypothetical protein [Halorarius halobius]|uniref:hypothetical protein n=1 Tax=Halorarius halobius TaxID=2962671 RepID=UPI0020CC96C8|nr:hypothetical protein [Halorarius halobius]
MSTDSEPVTKEELRTALDELILVAYENGVDVDNGGYALRHEDPELPDWEVVVTKTTKQGTPDN